MNKEEKYEAFDKALQALPDAMTIQELIIFIHGVCECFNSSPRSIGVALITSKVVRDADEDTDEEDDATEDVELSFKDEKLKKLLGR